MEAERVEARARFEAEQKAKAEAERQRLEAERKAKAEAEEAEREERIRQQRIAACQNWEQSLTKYLSELEPLKLRPEIHRRNDHFDMYTVFVQLPSNISADDMDVRVQGPTVTLAAARPITIPKHLQGYDFCEPSEEFPHQHTWERTWEFESPVEVDEVEAEIIEGHKLKIQFPNPPEHEIFHIPIKKKMNQLSELAVKALV